MGHVAADGSRYLTVTLDVINPYADVQVGYQTTCSPLPSIRGDSRGTVTIARGQKAAIFVLPAPDAGKTGAPHYVQLVQPVGALVGTPSVVALTAQPGQ